MASSTVVSSAAKYDETHILADFDYQTTEVTKEGNVFKVEPRTTRFQFKTDRIVPRLGVMLVGWGGNNGSTFTATVLANKKQLSWRTKDGVQESNYFGSIVQSSTTLLGTCPDTGDDVYAPLNSLLPMVDPNELVLDGWDISSMDLGAAMERAKVLDWGLQEQLREDMRKLKPRAAIFDKDFVADNQVEGADNVITGTKMEQVDQIRKDIRDFKNESGVDKVIVLWTANTERFSDQREGLNDTAENLMKSIKANEQEISPSTLFAVASILEKTSFLNGSPQNTFVPGCIDLAEREGVFIGGDDFKSGQTKFKSVIIDFLVGAGIKPTSIASYNHLGNNDGKNLSAPKQFRSKEISKSNVVDDMVASNNILYKEGEKPDHCVVIKYVPNVGDSKRAMDEFASEISMGGKSTIAVHNTCEDSLLAAPIILDLVLLTELCERIHFRFGPSGAFERFHPVLSLLSYLCKAPLVPRGAPVVNALFRQRMAIENTLRACIGLAPINHMGLEHRLRNRKEWEVEKARVQLGRKLIQGS